MPEADRFGDVGGDPPVIRAYRAGVDGQEVLVGYVFLTSDLPPEQYGYSGPVEALVGVRLDATLSGVRVTYYRESYRESMGDFLRRPGFQEHFSGKHIGEPFRVWRDVDGISRVTISVGALARGVRDSARRVANAYGLADVELPGAERIDPVGLSWFELRQIGVVERFELSEPGHGSAGIALALIESERLGRYFLGEDLYERGLRSAQRRGGAENLVLYAVDGSRLRLFRREGWSIVQAGDTTPIDPRDVVSLGLPSGGVVAGEATMIGLMLVDGTIDIAEPFAFVYDAGDFGVHTVEYLSRQARLARAEEAAGASRRRRGAVDEERPPEAGPATGTTSDGESVSDGEGAMEGESAPDSASEGVATTGTERDGASVSAGVADSIESALERGLRVVGADEEGSGPDEGSEAGEGFGADEDDFFGRVLADASWTRVATVLFVIGLATAAFVTKVRAVEWAALLATLIVLGFIDGGFLSISHVTSGIWAGPGVYARDLPLLLMVVFTLVTTLVWGRLFCGFLCPFGALQDVIDRLTPDRLKRGVPQVVHDRAVWVKYGVLAVVVLPPVFGSRFSVYQYVEPFGTVFFLSPSVLLWAIALAVLAASVVVPRFYCRYACPLGAGLALLAIVAPRRIRRVDQCDVCHVCEQSCPTGAIRGPVIDFPECVRCNACEVLLTEKAGACRHDMDTVRARLVTIEIGSSRNVTG